MELFSDPSYTLRFIIENVMEKQFASLAYYLFTELQDPHKEVEDHKAFFLNREVTGRIYLSEEGINGQMSGHLKDVEAYMAWLKNKPQFSIIQFKIQPVPENIFPRMTVKYRKQLVALDVKIDPQETATHVAPEEWKKMLESGEYLVLDVRNQYEWEIGHFEGATLPPLQQFREFPGYVEKLAKEVEPEKTKVMMYCTGGIRCELYSVLLKKKGFQEIYQLDGGVINYGAQVGQKHWKGKLFVFDDRLAIPISNEEAPPITQCNHCGLPCDTYYNCANMDCNELFICCSSCLEVYLGCCRFECKNSPRCRPFQRENNKPFRRKHLIKCAETE